MLSHVRLFVTRVLCSPWSSPVQNTAMGGLSLLQGIFPNQGSNPGLLHCRWILYHLSHQGSPRILERVAYPFSSGSSQPRNWTGVFCIAAGFFTNWAIREPPYINHRDFSFQVWAFQNLCCIWFWCWFLFHLFKLWCSCVYLFLPFSILHIFFWKPDMMYWVKEQVYRPLRDCFIFIWLAVRPCLLWLWGQRLKLPLMSLFLSPLFSLGFPGDWLNSVMVNFNVSTWLGCEMPECLVKLYL